MNNDLISREQIRKMLNEAFGCENATKYGNKNAEQQALSYSTLMLYEIANIVEDCCDNAPTVEYPFYQEAYQTGYEEGKNEILKGKCKDCDLYFKAMTKEEMRKGGAE